MSTAGLPTRKFVGSVTLHNTANLAHMCQKRKVGLGGEGEGPISAPRVGDNSSLREHVGHATNCF